MTKAELPPHTPRRRQGPGCWMVAFGALSLSMLLALLALLLPPFSLSERLLTLQYQSLSDRLPAAALGTFSVSLVDEASGGDFAVRLSREDFVANDMPLPDYLALQSPVYAIQAHGETSARLQFTLDLPPDAPPARVLSLYGWDGERWRFIPATKTQGKAQGIAHFLPQSIALFQTIPAAPIVAVSYDIRQELTADVVSLATILSPAGLRPTLTGGLIGSLAPGADADSDYLLLPRIANYDDSRATDPHTPAAIVANPVLRDEHIAQIAAVASYNRFDGVFIDYRDLPDLSRDDFSRFITQLADSLAERGLRLGVIVPPPRYQDGIWHTGAYDWRTLGEAGDYFQIRAALDPAAFAAEGPQSVNAMLAWAVDEVERYKILLGISAQSSRAVNGAWTPVGYHQALAGLGDVALAAEEVSESGSVEPGREIRAALNGLSAMAGFDDALNAPYLDYFDVNGNSLTRIFFTHAAALRHRLEHTLPFALAGAAFDDLLAADLIPGLSAAVMRYKEQTPRATPSDSLALRWSIEGSAGLVDEVIAGLNAELVLTLPPPEGNYAVNLAVVGLDAESRRQGAAVALLHPTPTPTPIPTPIPAALAPAPAANPVLNFAAVPPAPGSITIEIGGHVTDGGVGSGRVANAMKTAGMTWMKIQARYAINGPPDVAQKIAIAHSNGFKILVGTVGNPGELAGGGQSYINAYADWLARIAAQGADAIEVWNEPNLDREWPRGRISGRAYAEMLAVAYQKIKAASSGTMVISAAPAPTGVSDKPAQIMPDNQWLREVVAAGGLNYLDCVGVHYNEGIVPPSQTTGDPRGDNYYTRYFYGMLNGYASIAPDKPLCFTELGYVSSEGYPPLPGGFSWAQNVTVAQQAAWLAEAAALASQSGQVRLLIVWNIDFTHYSTGRNGDPQAGYAIIRPGGACPACTSLAQAR